MLNKNYSVELSNFYF